MRVFINTLFWVAELRNYFFHSSRLRVRVCNNFLNLIDGVKRLLSTTIRENLQCLLCKTLMCVCVCVGWVRNAYQNVLHKRPLIWYSSADDAWIDYKSRLLRHNRCKLLPLTALSLSRRKLNFVCLTWERLFTLCSLYFFYYLIGNLKRLVRGEESGAAIHNQNRKAYCFTYVQHSHIKALHSMCQRHKGKEWKNALWIRMTLTSADT